MPKEYLLAVTWPTGSEVWGENKNEEFLASLGRAANTPNLGQMYAEKKEYYKEYAQKRLIREWKKRTESVRQVQL